jgi:hypothetical protein
MVRIKISPYPNKLKIRKADLVKFGAFVVNFPWHPVFFAIYSILFHLHTNITQVDFHAADRLLLIFSVLIFGLVLLFGVLLRDIRRAGLVVFAFGLIFFTYPHVKVVLQESFSILIKNSILLPITALFLVGAFILTIRTSPEKLVAPTRYLNLLTLILVLIQIGLIFKYEYTMAVYWRETEASIFQSSLQGTHGRKSLPDLYFIVLDGYARADVLADEVGLDNSPFLTALRERQFYVADCSMSNYAQTEQSLVTTFNMVYLDEILAQINSPDLSEAYYWPYIKNNRVRQYFESLGYQTVAFYTGYSWSHWTDAAYFLGDPRVSHTDVTSLLPFESDFLSFTLLRYLPDVVELFSGKAASKAVKLVGPEADRAIVLYALDELPTVIKLRGPKLVYVHLMLPHPPYVFGPHGEEQDLSTNNHDFNLLRQGYRDQVLYANERMLPIIDAILEETEGNVFIVLEGDHGLFEYTDPADRMKNLSAYYFPDHDYSSLYPSITPVNTFRIILSEYFGQDYPILEDKSYFTATSNDQKFELIPNLCISEP